MEVRQLGYCEEPRHSLVHIQDGCYNEHYDISNWNSADWRKYHAFIRSLNNTKICRGFNEKA
jgi:hypothetical protein